MSSDKRKNESKHAEGEDTKDKQKSTGGNKSTAAKPEYGA